MTSRGYTVQSGALRAEAFIVERAIDHVTEVRDTLRAAFERDRRTLGSDQYGAELEKQLPAIEDKIFELFKGYLDELDTTAGNLRANAANYERAEGP
ncbi:hypothetical protein [Nonomuraea typhae]|uniref:hypothetical protein n=1 Tax=Nonomuraea typhae TaxID=2603600 RepID=UPI0012F9422B|nr:hypothetical protein [Nonomuraea typhae]